MILFVGSGNPVKIASAKKAATHPLLGAEFGPELIVQGFDVPSGIAEQPRSDEETREGAQNRARNAMTAGLALLPQDEATHTILSIGLEGGVFEQNGEMWSTVWGVVADQAGQLYEANGARMRVPEVIAERIRRGEELGPVVEKIVREHDVRSKQGMIGVVTKNYVDRTEEYSVIAKLALGIWFGREWAS